MLSDVKLQYQTWPCLLIDCAGSRPIIGVRCAMPPCRRQCAAAAVAAAAAAAAAAAVVRRWRHRLSLTPCERRCCGTQRTCSVTHSPAISHRHTARPSRCPLPLVDLNYSTLFPPAPTPDVYRFVPPPATVENNKRHLKPGGAHEMCIFPRNRARNHWFARLRRFVLE